MDDNIYSAKYNKLIKTLKSSSGRGINYILDVIYKILENPVAIFDTKYNLLANTENTVTDDPLWNELTQTGSFAHETVDFFNKEQFIHEYAKSDITALMKSDKLKYDRINGKLFGKDGIPNGNIIVVACYTPFKDEDFKLIEEICRFLSTELQKSKYYQNTEDIFEESFVSKLIKGKISDKTLFENKMNSLYSNLKANIYIGVIDITKYDPTYTHLAYFRDLFKYIGKEFKYYIYLNNIVIIISTDHPVLSIKNDMKELNEFFMKYNIYVGISSCFQNLFELQKYYKEAINALNYGMYVNGSEHIFKYDTYRMDHFLNLIKGNTNIRDLCNPVVFLMQEYDKENNTQYFNIVRTYFLHGGNYSLICEELGIEYDELCTHFQKISEIFEIDWNNGNVKVSIFMSIKILEYYS